MLTYIKGDFLPRLEDNHVEFMFSLRQFRGWSRAERVRDTYSWAWNFGFDLQQTETSRRCWVCKMCVLQKSRKPGQFQHTGLQNALSHLYNKHQIQAPDGKPKSREEKLAQSGPVALRSIATIMGLNTRDPAEQAFTNKLIERFDRRRFQQMLTEWIVARNVPFSTVEHAELRALFEYLNPQVRIQDANLTADSIRNKIVSAFHRHKRDVISILKESPGKIHFSFDGWRSNNGRNVYGVVAFFRRHDTDQPRKVVLGLPELKERHFGDNIAKIIISQIDSFEIGHKVGYFVLDNATNNDTAMDSLGGKYGFNGRSRRGRCFGHILNLSAKLLLFGNNQQTAETFLEDDELLTNEEYANWRKQGPVGKLRVLTIAIDKSNRLKDLLRNVQQRHINRAVTARDRAKKPYTIVKDNLTRWLGSLYMIRRARKLRTYLDEVKLEFRREWDRDNRGVSGRLRPSAKLPLFLEEANWLTPNDWIVLEHLEHLLSWYEIALKELEGDGQVRKRAGGFEGSYGNVWDVLPAYEFLLEKLESYKEISAQIPEPVQFKVGVKAAWEELDKYYSKLSDTIIYNAAYLLHPANKLEALEKMWDGLGQETWAQEAHDMTRNVWTTDYRNKSRSEFYLSSTV